jgi:hypothetical protein
LKLKPRFLFHANAAAIGGRIARPKDLPIDTPAASSLSAAGGRSTAKAEKGRIGEVIQFGSASTFAEGLFDDLGKWADTLCGDSSEDSLTATTSVNSEVRNLVVNARATFTAKRVYGGFVAKSPKGSGETSIALDRGTVFEGIALGGYKLIVELNAPVFQRFDTLSKLRTAADTPKFVKEYGASRAGRPPRGRGASWNRAGRSTARSSSRCAGPASRTRAPKSTTTSSPSPTAATSTSARSTSATAAGA